MFRNLRRVVISLNQSKFPRINRHSKNFLVTTETCCSTQIRSRNDDSKSNLFKPVELKPSEDESNVGAEITGKALDKAALLKVLNRFSQQKEIRLLCMENALDRE
jgi:hypothetical protein